MKNVVILTTRWDEKQHEVAEMAETQLRTGHFKQFIDNGAKVLRHDNTVVSARRIVSSILTIPPIGHLQVVDEMISGCSLYETGAGRELDSQLAELQTQHIQAMNAIRQQYVDARSTNDKAHQAELKRSREELYGRLQKVEKDKENLARMKGLRSGAAQGVNIGANIPFLPDALGAMVGGAVGGAADHLVEQEREKTAEARRTGRAVFVFAHSDKYPPYLKRVPQAGRTNLLDIFDFAALAEATVTSFSQPLADILFKMPDMSPDFATIRTMQDLVDHNLRLHKISQQNPVTKRDMYFNKNIGHRDDWYSDPAFGQQQFTGTNPTTITRAPPHLIDEFKTASLTQQRADVGKLLENPADLYVQDYSDFRSIIGVSASAEIRFDGRHGCASVVLFHLEHYGKLHPLAITLDYKGSMKESVTIFNRRSTSTALSDESTDWPWRYAKMCAQVSDWLRHEVAVHLVNTHLVEEVIIVSAHRTFEPQHIVFKLLEPHWNTTLSLNQAARETLVPKIIIGIIGLTETQTYAFLKDAYCKFNWTGSYVPNDLRRRGFPIEDLGTSKYHNYGYARNIADMWKILRKFVSTVLSAAYAGSDSQVKHDQNIVAFCQEVRSRTGGQLANFPDIKTLDELVDFATMCIHVASPQHTAVNYLQQYYQTFVPNKPSALYTRLPQSLEKLQSYREEDVLRALPIRQPRDWLMAQVPYLLSFEVSYESTILHYATTTSDLSESSTPQVIREAARALKKDLEKFTKTVLRYSSELDDQKTPYHVLDPARTAISILL